MKTAEALARGACLAMVLALAPMAAVAADPAPVAAAATPAADMTEGEVKKIDKSAGTVTLKHGDIPSLDMMGMTMVFKVRQPAMLDAVKVGDKVLFRAERQGGSFVVTEWQVRK